jgi:hypothetical protein
MLPPHLLQLTLNVPSCSFRASSFLAISLGPPHNVRLKTLLNPADENCLFSGAGFGLSKKQEKTWCNSLLFNNFSCGEWFLVF